MVFKRSQTVDPYKRPTKIPRTVATKLNRLSRAIAAQKPELREDTYFLSIASGRTTPLDLLVRASMESLDPGCSEIRLHRIRLAYTHFPTQPLWQILYTPKGTASPTACLYNTGNAWSVENFLSPPDATQSTVYKMLNYSGKIEDARANQIIAFDQRFSIPKKIRFDNEVLALGNPIDQLYYIGGAKDTVTARNICVTVWYTST